jgi:hypothetical protein
LSVSKSKKKLALIVEFDERCLQQVPYLDWHSAAGIEITVRLNGDQSITRSAVIGLSTLH